MRRRTVLVSLGAALLVAAAAAWLLLPRVHPSTAESSSPGARSVPAIGRPAAPSSGGARSGGAAPTPSTRVQRSARIWLEVDRGQLDGRIDRVLKLVADQGGFVAGVQPVASPSDGARSGQITFQVPVAKFDGTLVTLRRMGTTTDLQMSGADVSGQYVDVKARLANAQAQRDAYIALLGRAQSVQDVIAVQDKLGDVTGQIEEYQAQLDQLDQSTTYGTITVSITERAAGPAGFGAAFSQAGTNLVAVAQFLVVALGTVGPFLVLGGAVLAAWWWRRRRRPRPASATG